MSVSEQAKVALFIDWDNLAISTAADLSGAIPDVRAIVQRAQQYGTLIVAKAYAEWQANSERLIVYRAGIEPVYAPTFRFEPDTATQQGKGKSLADPCMVADCVDTLHLFSDIGVYVLVTGDKDLIPVVRLAQLRGRRVVVIGPDYVAGVLREMADEFVAYRSLVEAAPVPRPEPRRYGTHHGEEGPRRRGERHTAAFPRQERLPAAPPLVTASPIAPAAPAAPAPPVSIPLRGRVPEPEPIAEVAQEERGQAEDIRSVFGRIVEILQQRYDEGRDRIRATNLKDSLMQRMPGFSERRFGFAKFKDLLMAAEKSGLIRVTVAGPVHWISLPEAEHVQPPATEAPIVTPPAIPAASEAAVTTLPMPSFETLPVSEPAPVPVEERQSEMIRFIHDLRHRSRWLTYTYVLTNLISHFARTLSQNAAEAQARATLNHLVQEGILRVDKEPQEVEVGGAKHRVRMCHLTLNHPVVVEALGATEEEEAAEPVGDRAETPEVESGRTLEEPEGASGRFGAPELGRIGEGEEVGQAEAPPVQEGAVPGREGDRLAGVSGNGASSEGIDTRATQEVTIAEPSAEGRGEGAFAPAEGRAEGALPQTDQLPERPTEESAPQPQVAESSEAKRERAFGTLAQVLRTVTTPQKSTVSASTLRSRMVQALGTFNERDYGFSRFKDFLMAAQAAGVVRLETRGHVTLVALSEQAGGLPAGLPEER